MADSVGLGLLLNILFWTVAVLVAVGLGTLAVVEYFPGRERKARKGVRDDGGGTPAATSRGDADDAGERHRKAS